MRKEKKRKKTIIIISQQPRFHVEIRRTWRRRVSSGNAIRHYPILHLHTRPKCSNELEKSHDVQTTALSVEIYREIDNNNYSNSNLIKMVGHQRVGLIKNGRFGFDFLTHNWSWVSDNMFYNAGC